MMPMKRYTHIMLLLLFFLVFTHPVKAATITTITDHGFGYGANTFTKNITETTRTIIIVYEFTPWTSNTLITYTTWTINTTGTYTTTPVTTVSVGGTGTFKTHYVNSGTTTIVETYWGGIRTVVSQTGWKVTDQTTTITLKIYNSYSLNYTTTATIIEYLKTTTNETSVYTTTTYSETSTGVAWITNYTLTTLFTSTESTTILTIIENSATNVITYGNYNGRTEITTTLINRTLGETTVTTTATGTIDGAVKIYLDGYVDGQYYSTSTITVNYHYIAVLTTAEQSPIEYGNTCYIYIRWVWVFGYTDELYLWFNEWYVYVQF